MCAKGVVQKKKKRKKVKERKRDRQVLITEDTFHRLFNIPGESGERSACIRLQNNEKLNNNNKQQNAPNILSQPPENKPF